MKKPNLNFINDLSEGDVEFKNKLLFLLKKEFANEYEIYQNTRLNNDFNGAVEIVHKLKHKIGLLGLKENYDYASSFELDLKNKNFSKHNSFQLILDEISVFLNDL